METMMAHRLPLKDIEFIADFAAFCRTKGDEEYCYLDTGNCACAQFLRNTGRIDEKGGVGGTFWDDGYGNFHDLPDGVIYALTGDGRAFSALADRLDALLTDTPAEIVR